MAEYPVDGPSAHIPLHPGVILREDVLPALKMSVKDAASELGVSRQMLHSILKGTAAVTPEMALRLGKLCGNGPRLWLNLQTAYDLWHAQRHVDTRAIPTLQAAE